MIGIGRVCAKIYSPRPDVSNDRFVQIFHGWIRQQSVGGVLLDVADYTHVPDGPGVVLVGHDTTFSLDESDGRFGLVAQARRASARDDTDGVVATLEALFTVADTLERDVNDANLRLDRTRIRIEGNDRLRAPNTDEGFARFEAVVTPGARRLFANREIVIARVANDRRERLAVDVLVSDP